MLERLSGKITLCLRSWVNILILIYCIAATITFYLFAVLYFFVFLIFPDFCFPFLKPLINNIRHKILNTFSLYHVILFDYFEYLLPNAPSTYWEQFGTSNALSDEFPANITLMQTKHKHIHVRFSLFLLTNQVYELIPEFHRTREETLSFIHH